MGLKIGGDDDIAGEAQGGGRDNRYGALLYATGGRAERVMALEETWEEIISHGYWKRGKNNIFDECTFKLVASSYLCMAPEKAIENAEKEKEEK